MRARRATGAAGSQMAARGELPLGKVERGHNNNAERSAPMGNGDNEVGTSTAALVGAGGASGRGCAEQGEKELLSWGEGWSWKEQTRRPEGAEAVAGA